MKSWKQIMGEVGLVPPEQTLMDQEQLISEVGEYEFCQQYLQYAQQQNPEKFKDASWKDILHIRMKMRSVRQQKLGLYVFDTVEDDFQRICAAYKKYEFFLVQYRDGTKGWCFLNPDEADILDDPETVGQCQALEIRNCQTNKIRIGTVIKHLSCIAGESPTPVEETDCAEKIIWVKPINNEAFCSIYGFLKEGLEKYEKNHPDELPKHFREKLFDDLDSFSEGEDIGSWVFDAHFRTDTMLTYIGIEISNNYIEVSEGGSVYDPNIGSDSYTDWKYIIYNDGSEEGCDTQLYLIYTYLKDPDVALSIDDLDEDLFE